jgi:hypothetical protein
MKIIISFDTENASFEDDFDGEIKRVLKQAENYLTDYSNNENLSDINGNKIGNVFRSTCIRRSGF